MFENLVHISATFNKIYFAAAILAHRQSDLETAGARASEAVRARFSWEKAFNRIFGIYREIIAAWG
ncbi:MAG: hypothetical protein N2322_02540 [Terrimicrobiaceae bacterium]|nr:hypothetical protein [Terrimicrobiaceae bacterium]